MGHLRDFQVHFLLSTGRGHRSGHLSSAPSSSCTGTWQQAKASCSSPILLWEKSSSPNHACSVKRRSKRKLWQFCWCWASETALRGDVESEVHPFPQVFPPVCFILLPHSSQSHLPLSYPPHTSCQEHLQKTSHCSRRLYSWIPYVFGCEPLAGTAAWLGDPRGEQMRLTLWETCVGYTGGVLKRWVFVKKADFVLNYFTYHKSWEKKWSVMKINWVFNICLAYNTILESQAFWISEESCKKERSYDTFDINKEKYCWLLSNTVLLCMPR